MSEEGFFFDPVRDPFGALSVLAPVEAKGETPISPLELPQGILDLLLLKTVAPGPLHGWAISQRIQQLSTGEVQIQQGSLYPALHRLERRGWLKASWDVSENNRRAKYYSLTPAGSRQLETEEHHWLRLATAVTAILQGA